MKIYDREEEEFDVPNKYPITKKIIYLIVGAAFCGWVWFVAWNLTH